MHVRVTDAAIENLDLHVVLAGITALKVERRERRRGALNCVSIGFHKLMCSGNCIIWARRNEWGEHPIRFKRQSRIVLVLETGLEKSDYENEDDDEGEISRKIKLPQGAAPSCCVKAYVLPTPPG